MPTLEITTMIGCPLKCTFCPQDKLLAAYPDDAIRALSLDNFKIILAKVPPFVRIDFSGMSEPWANRFATDMLEHTLREQRTVGVYTTLQGMRDPERVAGLLRGYATQVEVVVVHLPDPRGNMRGFKDSDQYRASVSVFRELRGVRFMTMDDGNKSEYGPTDMVWRPITRAGNLDFQAIEGQNISMDEIRKTPVSCSFTPFYDQNVMLPNGDVLLCCMDYGMKHKIGNLLEDDYYDMFGGPGLGSLVSKNMQYGETDSICRKCVRAKKHDLGAQRQSWVAQR